MHTASQRPPTRSFRNGKRGLARQCARGIDGGAPPVCEQESAACAAVSRNTIRKSERQKHTRRKFGPGVFRTRDVRPAPCHSPRLLGPARAVASEHVEAMRETDVIATKAALRQQEGKLGRPFGLPEFTGTHDRPG